VNIELAWAAGFFDGEGWVTTSYGSRNGRRRTKPSLSVGVGQSGSPALLERFREAVGAGSVNGPYKHPKGGQDRFQYSVTGMGAHRVMLRLEPYLGAESPKWIKYKALVEVVV
jgi:hypothetical protein